MQELINFKQKNGLSVQSFIISGDSQKTEQELLSFLSQEIVLADLNNFPDILHISPNLFGVEESRLLKEKQTAKSLSGKGRFFILKIRDISIPAQNALLKILEEPAPNNYFFILVEDINIFLPTVLSRCQIIDKENKIDKFTLFSLRDFLLMSKEVRLLMLKDVLGKNKSGREEISLALNNLEILSAKLKKPENIEIIILAQKYLRTKRMTPKLIWEFLSLNLI